MQKGRRDHPAHHRGHQRREQKENQENAEKEAHLKIRNEKMDSIVPVAERKARRECVGTGGGRQVRFAAGEESPHGQKPMLPVLAGKVGELKMTSCERSEHSITSGRASTLSTRCWWPRSRIRLRMRSSMVTPAETTL